MSEDLRSAAVEQVFANSSQLESSSMALSFQPWLTSPNQRILQLHLKSHWLRTDKTDNDIHQPRISYWCSSAAEASFYHSHLEKIILHPDTAPDNKRSKKKTKK